MNSIRSIQKLNKRELEEGINPNASWHTDYRDTAFINIGGLPFELSEGDIITIFSQYGEPVWIKLGRDKETGKSRGFAWLKYEDQRSCDLAVDNMGGATVMDRVLRVDHARYKPRDDEDMRDNTMGEVEQGEDNDGRRKRQRTESESDSDDRPLLPEEIELEKALEKLDEEDPMKESLVKRLQEKADHAVKKYKKNQRREKERAQKHERRHRRDGSRHRDKSRERRRIRDRSESEDEQRHRSSRRHRDNSREWKTDRHRGRDRDRRDRSRERRHHSSDEDDRKHSHSRRSPRPSKDSHSRHDDDRRRFRSERDTH